MNSLNDSHDDFKLTFEIAIIEHLGINLYSEVHSAISELLANSYDAEAKNVKITLPLETDLGLEGQQIIIEDDGHGMTYLECRDNFLKIGRNRRKTSSKSKNNLRNVIGKKGIGKLAGFGIADQVHVITYNEFKKTEFLLNLKEIRLAKPILNNENENKKGQADEDDDNVMREYKPTLLFVEEDSATKQGTIVILEKIRQFDKVQSDDFKTRLSRKFAIFGKDFRVKVINSLSSEEFEITKFDLPTQFRFPKSGWTTEEISTKTMGKKNVKYWIGFTKSTIKDDALRGIGVISNGKSVQEPFDFKHSGGAEGQFGLQYMTGEVVADWLDEGAVDVIASDRASVRWTDQDASVLLEWGKEKLKSSLKDWAKLRAKATTDDIANERPEIKREIESYIGPAREELEKVVDRVASTLSQVGSERVYDVIQSIVTAYRHDHIRLVLKKILDGDGDLALFAEALKEWNLIDAVLTFEELSVKYSAIRTLKILVQGGATETKSKSGNLSLHEHLAAHPWLIDPMFSDMQSEKKIDNFIYEKYGKERKKKDDKRFDFILLYNSDRIRLVEIKSAKDPADLRGLNNLMDYHFRIKENEMKRNAAATVRSLLIYNGEVTDDARGQMDTIKSNPEYEVYTWLELLERNEKIYKEMLKRVKKINPNDPRVKKLIEAMEEKNKEIGMTDEKQRKKSKKSG